MKISTQKKNKRGSVLLLTLFILVILSMMGTAFMVLIPVEMRNAQKERMTVQTAFGADAALRQAMNDLQIEQTVGAVSTAPVDMGGGWQFQVENVEQLAAEEFRVTTVGLLRGDVRRRAVAIVDNGAITNINAIIISPDSPDGTQNVNSQGAWPADVPITGNVFVAGTWRMDLGNGQSKLASLTGPTVHGNVYHTDPSGSGLRGEEYTGGNLAENQYSAVYTNGLNAVQPYNSPLAQENLLLQDQVRQNVLGGVFGTTGAAAQTIASGIPNSEKWRVPNDGSGNMVGGIYVNPAGGQGNTPGRADVRLSTHQVGTADDGKPIENSVITVQDPENIITFYFVTEGAPTQVPITPVTGGLNLPNNGLVNLPSLTPNKDNLVVVTTNRVTGISTTSSFAGDFSAGLPLYFDAEITSIQGNHKGSHTIAAADGITITGEILKSDTPRGHSPAADSTDSLGLIACLDAGNSSPGMSLKLSGEPQYAQNPRRAIDVWGGGSTASDEFFVYTYVTALSKTDGNAKMFSENQHPTLPSGKTVSWIGNLTWAPTTAGHINTGMSFIESWKQIIVDPKLPPYFPNPVGGVFIPQLRSYVDIPVGFGE